jgi:hypothetical protein
MGNLGTASIKEMCMRRRKMAGKRLRVDVANPAKDRDVVIFQLHNVNN